MEEARALAQQQQLILQRQQQQQQQQHQLLLQQFQRQKQQQQQQQQQDAISRFPSNIDVHLRPQHFLHHRPSILNPQQSQSQLQTQPQPPAKSHPLPQQQRQQSPIPNSHTNPNIPNSSQQSPNSSIQNQHQPPLPQQLQSQQQQQQKVNQPPPPPTVNQAELQFAYQDAWHVCHPDFKRPFTSLEDACERLLPYHVVADYEAEEEDRILDSDTTGQTLSRSQQWDHNIAAKVAEFTATFEKQVLAFNIISRKRALGEFRSEERLMIEQALLQEERRAHMEARAELDSRQKAGRDTHEANMRMAAMVHAEQARTESQVQTEMVARTPIRANALGSQSIPVSEREQEVSPDEMINGWGGNNQRDEKEPSEDFLNDDEAENGDTGLQNEWRGGAELDLNAR